MARIGKLRRYFVHSERDRPLSKEIPFQCSAMLFLLLKKELLGSLLNSLRVLLHGARMVPAPF